MRIKFDRESQHKVSKSDLSLATFDFRNNPRWRGSYTEIHIYDNSSVTVNA